MDASRRLIENFGRSQLPQLYKFGSQTSDTTAQGLEVPEAIIGLIERYPSLLAYMKHLTTPESEFGVTKRISEFSHYFKPQNWADPLLLVAVETGIENTTSDNKTEIILEQCSMTSVDTMGSCPDKYCKLSQRGQTFLKDITMMYSAYKGEAYENAGNMGIVIPQLTELNPMYEILQNSQVSCHSCDDAPVIRAGLLLQCMADGQWMASNSYSACNLQSKGGKPIAKDVIWQQVDKRGALPLNTEQIPLTDGEPSTVYIVPLKLYNKELNYKVSWYEATIIPIYRKDLLSPFLPALIMAYTTTQWWNHAMYVDVEIEDERYADAMAPKKKEKLHLKMMPKAATVYIPGNFKHIILVIIDVDDTSKDLNIPSFGTKNYNWPIATENSKSTSYRMCISIENFQKIAFTWLGRYQDKAQCDAYVGNRDMMFQCLMYICRLTCFAGGLERAMSMVSELSYSMTMGNPVLTKRYSSDLTNLYGPRAFNIDRTKKETFIMDKPPDDWKMNGNDGGEETVYVPHFWRCSPHGLMTEEIVQICGDSKAGWPCLLKLTEYNTCRYQIFATDSINRILRAAGFIETFAKCSIYNPVSWEAFANWTLGHASFQSGICGWMMCELGINIIDINKLASRNRSYSCPYTSFLSAVTYGFFRDIHRTNTNSWIKSDSFTTLIMKLWPNVFKNSELYDNWYTIHVPSWYVFSVARMYGVESEITPNDKSTVREPMFDCDSILEMDELDGLGRWECYDVSKNDAWYILPRLTMSVTYDQRKFNILAPNNTGKQCKPLYMGWVSYAHNDYVKQISLRMGVNDNECMPMVELLAMPFLAYRDALCYKNFTFYNNDFTFYIDLKCQFPPNIRNKLEIETRKSRQDIWTWAKGFGINIESRLVGGNYLTAEEWSNYKILMLHNRYDRINTLRKILSRNSFE